MASHVINISTVNQVTGIASTSDGVMGLLCKGVAIGSTFALNTFYLLTKADDLTTLGITAALDATNKTAIYQHVTEFYAQAGDGAKLWLGAIAKATSFATFVASSTFSNMVKGTAAADPANQIKVIGLGFDVPLAGQTSADFPDEVLLSVTALHNALLSLETKAYFLSGVVDGYNMSTAVTPATLGTQATNTAYKVSLLITGTTNNRVSSIGQYLGKLSRITIGTSPGRVIDGALNATVSTMYLTNQVDVKTLDSDDFVNLGNKQYVFACTLQGYSGYFYNDGATCEATTKALSSVEPVRTADYFSAVTYTFLIAEREKRLPVDKKGNLDAGYCANLASQFKAQYIQPKIDSDDITDATLSVAGVNFNTTRTMTYALSILRGQTYTTITATIQFVNSL